MYTTFDLIIHNVFQPLESYNRTIYAQIQPLYYNITSPSFN